MNNKKIFSVFICLMILFSLVLFSNIQLIQASPSFIYQSADSNYSYGQLIASSYTGSGFMVSVVGNNEYLKSYTFYFKGQYGTISSGTMQGVCMFANGSRVENSTVIYDFGVGGGWLGGGGDFLNTYRAYTFAFSRNVVLSSSATYYIGAIILTSLTDNWEIAVGNSNTMKLVDTIPSFIDSGNGGGSIIGNVITESGANPTPTPVPTSPPVSGSVGVNFKVNNSINYNSYGNITWTVLQEGIQDLVYYVGNSGSTYYFNDLLTINIKPQLLNGWYFQNYTVITNTNYNYTYPIDNHAFILNSSKGTIWNITMIISQTPNLAQITLIDVSHGSIYFQNIINSQPSGIRYGAGIYNINYGTVLYISTLPDSGYVTDYFTVIQGGITSIVSSNSITIITVSNTTITPHYSIISDTGVTGGSDSILIFLRGFTWQNIAVLIIYAVVCGLLTYAFAFTGLIAGLDIATIICFIMGLLGNLMYPVLGLVIVANIALIITGSGLLNRKRNGTDA